MQSEEELEEIRENNMRAFKDEELQAFALVQKNRHRSVEPYEWFGPKVEPTVAGPHCECAGCEARRIRGGMAAT